MALSNILREPQREITEQVIGLALLASWLGCGYGVARWVNPPRDVDFIGLILLGTMFPVALGMALWLVHEVGERVCAFLANHGYDPRPARRY